jgi:hypothetical protein
MLHSVAKAATGNLKTGNPESLPSRSWKARVTAQGMRSGAMRSKANSLMTTDAILVDKLTKRYGTREVLRLGLEQPEGGKTGPL